ncbi:MAG: GspH/FimT family pseudopilin [Cycloclasticus sp.]|nr:GspH/FimT family pseudopilin [Cycloclasticus sp.]
MKTHQQHVSVKAQQGFTLIELLTTVIIAGILLAIAVPSYQEFIRKNHTVTQTNNLVSALNLARSEAIKRGIQVTIHRKGSTSQVWNSGWDIYTDIDGDGSLTDDADANLCETGEDCLLRTYDSLPDGYTLRTGANYDDWVAYLPSGLSRSSSGTANDTFRVCANYTDNAEAMAKGRAITVNTSGRPRTSIGTASCP